MSETSSVNKELGPNYWLLTAIGIGFCVATWVIAQRAMNEHRAAMEGYQQQLNAIDPARVQQWHRAAEFEQLATRIRAEYLGEHLLPEHLPEVGGEKLWAAPLTHDELLVQLRTNPVLVRAANHAGYTLEETCRQIIADEIAVAGPSPLLSPPTRTAPAVKATLMIGTAGVLSLWGVKRARTQRS